MSAASNSYRCGHCHKTFYSQATTVKGAHTRHLGQCLRLRRNSSNEKQQDERDITFQHAELINNEDFLDDYFMEEGTDGSTLDPIDADTDRTYANIPDSVLQNAYETFGEDRVMIDATLAGTHIILSAEEKAISCPKIFEFQQLIEQNYDRNVDGSLIKKPIIIRSLDSSRNLPRFWEDTVDIFNLWVAMNISISDGDKILSTIKSICRRNFKEEPQLPVSMKSIVEACKGSEDLFPSSTWVYHLPAKYFGTTGLDGNTLKPTTAVIKDVGTVIGRALLDVNVDNFAFSPDIVQSNIDHQRLYGAYSTGTLFEELHKAVIRHAVNNNNIDCPTVALALGISSDGTTLNKGQSIEGNGLQLLLMNVCGKDRKPNLVGMIPEKNNIYSVRQLHQILKNRGFKFKKDRTAIIDYVNRQMKLSYISEALSPLLLYQQNGMTLQVGSIRDGTSPKKIRAYPHVTIILADTLESNKYAGVSMKTKRQCRCCLQTNCCICLIESAIGDIRNQNHHNIISTLAGTIQELMWSYTGANPGRKLKLTENQKRVLNEASRLCIQFGHNPMYVHFSLQNSWGVNSLHEAVLPDSLHTWSKGLIESLISQTLICFRQVSRLAEAYSHNLSDLDTNISAFPAHHTLNPWKFSRFVKGITCYSKKNKTKKEGTCTTGFFSGSIQACRLSGLLAQVLFSIRLDGSSLPTGELSNQLYADSLGQHQDILIDDRLDIQNTLVDAIVVALDFDIYSRSPFMKSGDIMAFKELLSNTVFKFIKVFRMNSLLSQLRNRTSECTETVTLVAKNPGGVKMHLLFHSLDNIERVGKEKSSSDTEITESYNKVIKGASQCGTQKTRTEGEEIIKCVDRSLRAKDFESLTKPINYSENYRMSSMVSTTQIEEDIPMLEYVVARNCSHQNIVLDYESSTVVVEEKFRNVHGKRVPLLPLVHEMLSLDMLFKLLSDKYTSRSDRQFRLLNSLKCLGSSVHGIEPFMIHANSNFCTEVGGHVSIQSNRPDFGFLKVDVEDDDGNTDQFSALVVGIIEESSVNVLEKNRVIFNRDIIVCWLENVSDRDKLEVSIPYPQIKFSIKNKSPGSPLWFDVIPTSSIKAPLFVVPIISSLDNFYMGQSFVSHQKKIKFFELSLDRVIFWSASEYDNFTETGTDFEAPSLFDNMANTMIDQFDIENESDRWGSREVGQDLVTASSNADLSVVDCTQDEVDEDDMDDVDDEEIEENSDD